MPPGAKVYTWETLPEGMELRVAIEGLSLLVYLEHNVDPRLAKDARRAGYDAVAAIEVGNAVLEDVDQHGVTSKQRLTARRN